MKTIAAMCVIMLFTACSTKTINTTASLVVLPDVPVLQVNVEKCGDLPCVKGSGALNKIKKQCKLLRAQNEFYKEQAKAYNYILSKGGSK